MPKARPDLTPVTYEEMSNIFSVNISTIRNWKYQGKFKILGYRRLRGWGKKEALVDPEEVKRLWVRRLIRVKGKYAFK